ncbi:MAG: sulfurtransferase TusA family protein [Cyanobacteriota bacterium]
MINSVKKIDLRTTGCPINFVKSKLELDKLNSGDILEIWIDEGESAKNVPESLRLEGHEILELIKSENYYIVLVKKA